MVGAFCCFKGAKELVADVDGGLVRERYALGWGGLRHPLVNHVEDRPDDGHVRCAHGVWLAQSLATVTDARPPVPHVTAVRAGPSVRPQASSAEVHAESQTPRAPGSPNAASHHTPPTAPPDHQAGVSHGPLDLPTATPSRSAASILRPYQDQDVAQQAAPAARETPVVHKGRHAPKRLP